MPTGGEMEMAIVTDLCKLRTRVYIAGPISNGSLSLNISSAVTVAKSLIKHGYSPLTPHLTCYLNGSPPAAAVEFASEVWYEVDLSWVAVANAVLRLPGESKGADMEVEVAKDLGIPVFENLDRLFKLLPPCRPADSQLFYNSLREIANLYDMKSHDYGKDVDPLANVRGSTEWGVAPWVGAMIRLTDKVRRLQKYASVGRLANESVHDSFVDIAAYALIADILHKESVSKEALSRGIMSIKEVLNKELANG